LVHVLSADQKLVVVSYSRLPGKSLQNNQVCVVCWLVLLIITKASQTNTVQTQ